jgi:hypothetical protein
MNNPRRVESSARAKTINDGKNHDRAKFSEKTVGNNRSQKRHEVSPENKKVIGGGGVRVGHGGRTSVGIQKPEVRKRPVLVVENLPGHEGGQDRVHAVKAEALGRLADDDVGNARRQPRGLDRRGGVAMPGGGLREFFRDAWGAQN